MGLSFRDGKSVAFPLFHKNVVLTQQFSQCQSRSSESVPIQYNNQGIGKGLDCGYTGVPNGTKSLINPRTVESGLLMPRICASTPEQLLVGAITTQPIHEPPCFVHIWAYGHLVNISSHQVSKPDSMYG